MKKRILSVIFAALMLSACAFGFAACDNATAGQQDNEVEQGSNGDNTQGGGTENDPQGGDEPAVRTTVTEEEWRSALRMDGVRNVTMTIDVELNGNGTLQHYFAIGKIDEDRWYYRQTENEIISREEYYKILEKLSGNMDYADPWLPDFPLYPATEYAEATIYLANIYTMANDQWTQKTDRVSWGNWQMGESFVTFENYFVQFTYNPETAQYEANRLVLTDENGEQEFEGIFIYPFENGKITKFEFSLRNVDAYDSVHWFMSFSDYGTTSVTLPEVSVE